jgi:5-(carboxyamino)imidazole ribonucleotide mutase
VGVGKARNAGLLAARILGVADPTVRAGIDAQRAAMAAAVREKDARLRGE